MTILAIAGAGALGASARFVVERLASRRFGARFPWGTMLVNVTGSFAVGLLTARSWHGVPREAVTTGFLGAYTTFSTYALETVRLAQHGAPRRAVAYLAGTVALATSAAWAGLATA